MKRVNAFLHHGGTYKHELSPTLTSPVGRPFEHKPLDETQSSLRLLTLSSELSADGCIQCYVSHSTLERASYVCLSYWYGVPEYVRIHINGAPFYVRKNLFDFLEMARNLPMTFYWIDAICLDMNSISERNHQIKQMGQIYSRAFLVYAWLGKLPQMAPFMSYLRHGSKGLNGQSVPPRNTIIQARDMVKSCVFNNEYWSRAWVTEELFLARNVLILLGRETFKFPDLVNAMSNFEHPDLLSGFGDCTFEQFSDMISNPAKYRAKTLINLIDEFREKECEVPRDRIYSLLPICHNFQHPEVDYHQSVEDLAFDVLKRSDEPLCTCSALLIAQTLQLVDPGQHRMEDACDQVPYIEFDVRGLRFARHAMLCNDQIHSWGHYKLIGTDMFGHDLLHCQSCFGFESLMDALQACAMDMSMTKSPIEAETTQMATEETPSLLRIMDDHHAQAMLHGFGPALRITKNDNDANSSTVSVALWLLAELVPQSIPLCQRFGHRKEKPRDIDEVASWSDYEYTRRSLSIERRGTEIYWGQNADVRRIDSAGPGKSNEEEGPISRLRLVKRAVHKS